MVQLDGVFIEEVNKAKLLGITFDSYLKWGQIDLIYNTTNSRLYLLKRIRHSLPLSFRIQFYYSLIYSHLLYTAVPFGVMQGTIYLILLILQKRAARLNFRTRS
jgi:hypothetical protein